MISLVLHQTTQAIFDGHAKLERGGPLSDGEGQLDGATFKLLRASGGTRLLRATTMDDVGRTLDIVQCSNVSVSSSFGRHTNDMMLGFYMQIPIDFDIEYGCEVLAITDGWTPSVHYAPCHWGNRGGLNP